MRGKEMVSGFFSFIRERGVAGFAIGFMMGGAAVSLVNSFVSDILNPLLTIAFGGTTAVKELTYTYADVAITYGNFLANMLNFFIIALVVYIGFKLLGLEKIDKK